MYWRPQPVGCSSRRPTRWRGSDFIAIWAYASSRMEHYVLPSPWAVAQRMWQLAGSGVVLTNFVDSLWRTVLGWTIAVIIGSVLGVPGLGRYRYARAFFHDLIYLAANVPLIVYAIVAIIVFGSQWRWAPPRWWCCSSCPASR